MPIKVGIVGNYGSGKSTSIMPVAGHKGLNPDETLIINSLGKDLPVKGFNKMYNKEKKNIVKPADVNQATTWIRDHISKMKHIKNIVIDDFIYLTTKHLIEQAEVASFQKYNTTVGRIGSVMNALDCLDDDVFVFVMFHQEVTEQGTMRVKSASKMIDSLMNLEGIFTYVLFTDTSVDDNGRAEYSFITNTTNNSQGVLIPAKSPIDCFPKLRIPNDLGLVVDYIKAFREG